MKKGRKKDEKRKKKTHSISSETLCVFFSLYGKGVRWSYMVAIRLSTNSLLAKCSEKAEPDPVATPCLKAYS